VRYGLAWADLSAGRFLVEEVEGDELLLSELARLDPAKCCWPTRTAGRPRCSPRAACAGRAPWYFEHEACRRQLLKFFDLGNLDGFGIEDAPLAIAAAGALLGYVQETQKARLPHLGAIVRESADDAIALSAVTRRHLELDARSDGRSGHTLLSVLDSTVSPMGGRLLRRWLQRPLRDQRLLGERHHAVQALLDARADADSARGLSRHRRPRAHPGAGRAALGAPARPVDAARRPCRAAGAAHATGAASTRRDCWRWPPSWASTAIPPRCSPLRSCRCHRCCRARAA
jgi:DNA mismatch repair protein MutS